MKYIAAAFFCIVHGLASAYDGVSLKNGLDAYDRMYVTKNASDDDFRDATMLIAYISGMLAVHRANNLTAALLGAVTNSESEGHKKQMMSEADSIRSKTVRAFTPLHSLPQDIPPEQLVAILRKFLNEHPERWNQHAATLITDALAEAFPRK